MGLLKYWRIVYREPEKGFAMIDGEETAIFGLKAYTLRGVIVSLVFYIPLVLMSQVPSIPSYITFWPTQDYYLIMVFVFPLVGIMIWLLTGSLTHLVLTSISENNDFIKLLNISGLATLAVLPLLLVFDWVTLIFLGGIDAFLLGISHIIIDFYYLYLLLIGYKQNLDISKKTTVILYMIQMLVAVPLAMLFIRGT